MRFLRNAWYCAAWAEELADAIVARTILSKPVVLFRTSNGDPVALQDICPHRFVPLSAGAVKGDAIECPYHGLQYGASGDCVHNPHGPVVPKAAKVFSYPVIEKYQAIWIWTGDIEKADPALIPDFSLTPSHVPQARYSGRTHTLGNYQLVVDNLLDLSHVHWVHPQLRTDEGMPTREKYKVRQVGETLHNDAYEKGVRPNPLFQRFWNDEIVDFHALMRWDAPSCLLFQLGVDKPGAPFQSGISLLSAHLVTPETEASTHYFWNNSRNVGLDEETTAQLLAFTELTFTQQDSPMVALQQKTMGTTDLMSLNPILLPTDVAAGRARQILQAKIDAEEAERARLECRSVG